jgi:hypothetical protein
MPQPTIAITDAPDATEVALISAALDDFNVQKTGFQDRRPLAVLVKDSESGWVVGGLTGRTSLGLLFVDLFHLPPELRGLGIGTKVLRGGRRGPQTRLPDSRPLHHQLPGTAVLPTPRLAGVRPDPL